MFLKVGTLTSKAIQPTPDERRWLDGYLTFTNRQAHFSGGPAKQRMYNTFNDSFPSGFIPYVVDAAKDEGFQVRLVDTRKAPAVPNFAANLSWLRDYQREAVGEVVGKKRGVLWLPTGSGKTEIAIACVMSFPTRWLFLVHRTRLMHQAADRWEKYNPHSPAGRIGEGIWDFEIVSHQDFISATFQTVYSALKAKDPRAKKLLDSASGLFVDEAHVLPADSFWKVSMSTPNAYYRVGLSGTPLARGDRRGALVIASLGPIIYRMKASALVDAGILAKPRIMMVEVEQVSAKPTFQGVYTQLIVKSTKRNNTLIRMCKRASKPCMLFVKQLKHGRDLVKRLGRAGMAAQFIYGDHSDEWRRRAIEALERSSTDVLVTTKVLQEGIDIPSLRSVVIGSGGKSVIEALQRIGRGMRLDSGKTEFEVYDVKDIGNNWLENHTNKRLKAYASEGHGVTVLADIP